MKSRSDIKKLGVALILIAVSGYAIGAQAKGFKSAYTSIDPVGCVSVESTEKGSRRNLARCRGKEGYELEVIEQDARMTMNVITRGGVRTELDFDKKVSSAFSWFGDVAEWRYRLSNRRWTLSSLIVRFEISEPDHPDNPGNKSFLVIIDLRDNHPCIAGIVKPTKNQNTEARSLADTMNRGQCSTTNRK